MDAGQAGAYYGYGLQVLNAAGTITEQQHMVRRLVARELEGSDEGFVAAV